SHKSDVGGVVLDLETPEDVENAASEMLERVARVAPDARVDGVMVQEMVIRRGAYELIVGMNEDAQCRTRPWGRCCNGHGNFRSKCPEHDIFLLKSDLGKQHACCDMSDTYCH
ncbi:MAG: acetate--CoA ligase family protein, partial [Hyphomicrobiaceae bacterium]|nr:acetate--CoA ligase family protein [Hyphomicrobiaceae bacterium]